MGERKSIIWNISRICAYDCPICCIDAYHVSKENKTIQIRIDGLTQTLNYKRDRSKKIFDDANTRLQKKGLELYLDEKLKILDNLDAPVKIDFSGGDPLLLEENVKVIAEASKKFGRDHISITSTGVGLSSIDIDYLNRVTKYVEFTYDFFEGGIKKYRSRDYNYNNLKNIEKLNKTDITTTAQTPLNKDNVHPNIIENIFHDLHEADVDNVYFMKTFPVGRATNLEVELPTRDEYSRAIDTINRLKRRYKNPKVRIQSILAETKKEKKTNKEKYYISNSLNITNLGLLSLSPWAYDDFGNPKKKFVLGDLKINKLSELYTLNTYVESLGTLIAKEKENNELDLK